MCGEQAVMATTLITQLGSPPRVRGTELLPLPAQWQFGITPACAGNSGGAGCSGDEKEDHPRVCGEQYAIGQ